MAFDPDAYLAKKGATVAKQVLRDPPAIGEAVQSQGFDPDVYLAKKTGGSWKDIPLPWGTAGGTVQGTLDALPTAGMVAGGAVGGLLGGAAGGVGALPGAIGGGGLGGGAGESLKQLGEKYIMGQDKTRADIYGKPALGLVEGAGAEMGGNALGGMLESKGGKWALGKLGSAGSKIASTFTGVPQKEIETYAKNVPEINKMAASADYDPQELADIARGKINEVLKGTRGAESEKISKALSSASKDKNINVTAVVDALEQYKARLNPSLHPEAINDVDNLIGRIKGTVKTVKNEKVGFLAPNEKLAIDTGSQAQPRTELMSEAPNRPFRAKAGPDGWNENSVPVLKPRPEPGVPNWNAPAEPETSLKGWKEGSAADDTLALPTQGRPEHFTNAQTLQDVVKFLQDQGAPAYGKSPVGFNIGDAAAGAAKSGAASARKIMQESGPKEISQANEVLSRLHEIEDVMNKSMLKEGKTGAPLYAAGSGANGANAKVLRELGKLSDSDLLGEVEKIAAARQFGKPSLLPVDATGKSLTRMGAAGGLGYLVGHVPGAVIAEGLASPAALKAAINTGHAVAPALKNPEMQALVIQEYMRRKRSNGLVKPGLIKAPDKDKKPGGKISGETP